MEASMDLTNVPKTWPWAEDEQGRRDHGQYFLPSKPLFAADTLPPLQPFTIDSAPAAPTPIAPTPIRPSTYLPLPYDFPTLASSYAAMANDYQVSEEWRNTFPQFTRISAPQNESTGVAGNATRARARALSEPQLNRRSRLEDEAYPLKLVRALASDGLPRVDAGDPVFGVIHFNNTVSNNLTAENVSTYRTVKAANDRVMDFWDQTYGTGMFTSGPLSFDEDILFAKFEYVTSQKVPVAKYNFPANRLLDCRAVSRTIIAIGPSTTTAYH